jgi:hypothetical membrane protein
MKRLHSLSFLASIIVMVWYLVFAVLALSRYPSTYSPLYNWLSDLGNAYLNPSGAVFYNIGIVVSGGVMLLFFLGLVEWRMANNRIQNQMLYVMLGFGILGALALLMSGFYPMNFLTAHSIFSTWLFILLGTSFAFSVAALRYHPACPLLLLILGALTAIVTLVYGFFHSIIALEWVTVALFLCYVGLLGAQTNRLSSANIDRSTMTVTQ